MTQIINNIILIGANIAMAAYHAGLIKKNKPIKHGLWTAGYLVLVAIFCLLFIWWYLPVGIFIRGVIFSPALSLFRGLPINYTSSTTTSITDKLEYRLFKGNWYKRMLWYVGLLLLSEIVLITST